MDLAAARYYDKHFPHELVLKLLSRSWRGTSVLPCRELCIETVDDICIRYMYM